MLAIASVPVRFTYLRRPAYARLRRVKKVYEQPQDKKFETSRQYAVGRNNTSLRFSGDFVAWPGHYAKNEIENQPNNAHLLQARGNEQVQIGEFDIKALAQVFVTQTPFIGIHPVAQSGVIEQQMLNTSGRAGFE